ncbi:DUF945 family protein [Pseudomonas mediterranea]|uniref:DUF945 family protein n=1 Tax=Pseudomonas mediterranea TaxID=183795 RepID=UPI0023511E9A|nr:DUF945 family protein [Pseudomonas mediterranea]
MNKSASVLLGIVVAIGAVSAGGAWYTGTKLEGVLQTANAESNKQMVTALAGSKRVAPHRGGLRCARGIFSSTAHYRLKGEGDMFGGEAVELMSLDTSKHAQTFPYETSSGCRSWLPATPKSSGPR